MTRSGRSSRNTMPNATELQLSIDYAEKRLEQLDELIADLESRKVRRIEERNRLVFDIERDKQRLAELKQINGGDTPESA